MPVIFMKQVRTRILREFILKLMFYKKVGIGFRLIKSLEIVYSINWCLVIDILKLKLGF